MPYTRVGTESHVSTEKVVSYCSQRFHPKRCTIYQLFAQRTPEGVQVGGSPDSANVQRGLVAKTKSKFPVARADQSHCFCQCLVRLCDALSIPIELPNSLLDIRTTGLIMRCKINTRNLLG